MTNDEFQMTKEIRNPNVEGNGRPAPCWGFELLSDFVIVQRHEFPKGIAAGSACHSHRFCPE